MHCAKMIFDCINKNTITLAMALTIFFGFILVSNATSNDFCFETGCTLGHPEVIENVLRKIEQVR